MSSNDFSDLGGTQHYDAATMQSPFKYPLVTNPNDYYTQQNNPSPNIHYLPPQAAGGDSGSSYFNPQQVSSPNDYYQQPQQQTASNVYNPNINTYDASNNDFQKQLESYHANQVQNQPQTYNPPQQGYNTPIQHAYNGGIQNHIAQMARQMGVDPNLALTVAKMESGFRQNAHSGAGAIGMFQLMPNTARGLHVNPYTQEGNIQGGLKYLKQLQNVYGKNTQNIFAGYNAGPGAVQSGAWRKYGETRNYVQRGMRLMNGGKF